MSSTPSTVAMQGLDSATALFLLQGLAGLNSGATVSAHAMRHLVSTFADRDAAEEFADAITTRAALSDHTQRLLTVALCNDDVAKQIINAVASGGSVSAGVEGVLAQGLCDSDSAKEILLAIQGV